MKLQSILAVLLILVARPALGGGDDGSERYFDGIEAMAEGNFAPSLAALDDAARLNPYRAAYQVDRAVDLIMLGRGNQAKAALDAAASQDPQQTDLLIWRYVWQMSYTQTAAGVGRPDGLSGLGAEICDAATFYRENPRGPQHERNWASLQESAAQYGLVQIAGVKDIAAERALSFYRNEQFAEAAAMLDRLREVGVRDADLIELDADCKLAAGDLGFARDMYTAILIANPEMRAPYLGRARCEIAEGDLRDAKSDLDVARAVDPSDPNGELAKVQGELDAAGAAAVQQPAPDALLLMRQYQQALASGQSDQSLLAIATQLERLRYATSYVSSEEFTRQRTLLTLAVQRDPKNVRNLVALAEFLLQPRVVRRISTPGTDVTAPVPCSPGRHDADQPLIDRLLKAALALDPGNAEALELSAMLAERQQRYDDEVNDLNAASKLGAVDFRLAVLTENYYVGLSDQEMKQAADIRQPSARAWHDTDPRTGAITYHNSSYTPTPQDLQRAEDLEHQSNQNLDQAAAMMNRMIEMTKGSNDRLTASTYDLACAYYLSAYAKFEDAQRHAEAAVNTWPYNLGALDFLSDFAAAHQNPGLSQQCQDAERNMINPSPIGWLAAYHADLDAKNLDKARSDLDHAQQQDPTSVANFIARLDWDEAQGNADDAIVAARAIVILEEARLNLIHRTLNPSAPGTIAPQDALTAINAHVRAGLLLEKAGRKQEASDQFRRAVDISGRVSTATIGGMNRSIDADDSSMPPLGPEAAAQGYHRLLQTAKIELAKLTGQPAPSDDFQTDDDSSTGAAPKKQIRG